MNAHLVFLQATLLHQFVPLLLERDDDQGDEDVDEEEREDDEVHDVEDGHLHAVASARAMIFLGHVYWVLENPETAHKHPHKQWLKWAPTFPVHAH